MFKICLVAVDIRSTHNVGSLFRTCDGFGADLFLVGITPHPVFKGDKRLPHVAKKAQAAIEKTALGAENSVSWRYFETFNNCYEYLVKNGYTVVAIEQMDDSIDITNLSPKQNTALIVGPEVEGLPKDILNFCSKVYEIPMKGKKESFNVSVAAGIALYQASSK